MQTPDWRQAAGGLLVITMFLSLAFNGLPERPYQWLLAVGGLGIAAGLALPKLGDRIPRYHQLTLAAVGVGGFWYIIAESSGLIEAATSLLGGAIIAVATIAITHWQHNRTAS